MLHLVVSTKGAYPNGVAKMLVPKPVKGIVSAGLFLLAFTSLSISQPVFAPPQNLGPTINTSAVESDPFWDGPRNRLYFVRDFDIWYAQWNGTSWNSPIKLGPQINSGPGIEQSPNVSPDGQKLYIVADARFGYFWDIWVSTWNSSLNDWGTPVNVGYPVNTPGVEFSAHLAPDGVSLYFDSSNDADSLFPNGRYGIYASEWNGSSWSLPILQWDLAQAPVYPSLASDGQWLFYRDISDIFAVQWMGSGWGPPAYNLRQQLGGRATSPLITPSGDSLFFSGTPDLGGYGSQDIWLTVSPSNVRLLSRTNFLLLAVLLFFTAAYWMKKKRFKESIHK